MWRAEIHKVAGGRDCSSGGDEPSDPGRRFERRREHRHRMSPLSDLENLAGGDATKIDAQILTKLADSDPAAWGPLHVAQRST